VVVEHWKSAGVGMVNFRHAALALALREFLFNLLPCTNLYSIFLACANLFLLFPTPRHLSNCRLPLNGKQSAQFDQNVGSFS